MAARLIFAACLAAVVVSAVAAPVPDMPVLNQAYVHHFAAPYSCGGNYSTSAFFLARQDQVSGDPTLLFNGGPTAGGGCIDLTIDGAPAGTDTTMFTKLGPAEKFLSYTAQDAYDATNAYTVDSISAETDSTYAAIHMYDTAQAIILFRFTSITGDGVATMEWTAKAYFGHDEQTSPSCVTDAPGFSWTADNKRPSKGLRGQAPLEMPQLNVIQSFSANHSYSCGGTYAGSALFLTAAAKAINEPDLLWDGPCGGPYYFQAATSGTDFDAISLYDASVTLEKATSTSLGRTVADQDRTDVMRGTSVQVGKGDLISVFRSTDDSRMWAAVQLTSAPGSNGAVTFDYAVRLYETADNSCALTSPGFDWSKPTLPPQL